MFVCVFSVIMKK